MGIGIVGAIDGNGDRAMALHYAVSVAYLVQVGWNNQMAAQCKLCGQGLVKGKGTKAIIAGGGPRPTEAYFCQPCVGWVQASVEVVMDRRAKDAMQKTDGEPK